VAVTRRAFLAQSALTPLLAQPSTRPNILWISIEDSSPQLGCYGDPLAITPNVDKLATEGVRFTRAHAVIGVCAPCRSSIISGLFPPSLGTHNMRSMAKLPAEIKCFPEYLQEAGYYCTNNAKTDYNFAHPKTAWNESSAKAHWKNRPAGVPFFAVFNLQISHESRIPPRGAAHLKQTPRLKPEERSDPGRVTVPPYYPDTPEVRRDLANVHENLTQMDYEAGDLLKQIDDAGLRNDTIVFFWSDHGVGMPRAKRWLYNSSTHVPLIVRIPEKFRQSGQGRPASTDDQLVSLMDLGPTVLNLGSARIPSYMQGRAFLGTNLTPKRHYVYGARDRMDERYDMVRMVSDGRYRYIRNFDYTRPHYQYMNTSEQNPTMRDLRRLHDEKKLHETADRYFHPKPREELYDTQSDPHEIRNLATDPAQSKRIETMRAELLRHMRAVRDLGLIPEPELMRLEEKYGSRYAILRHPDNATLLDELLAVKESSLLSRHASVRARAAATVSNRELLEPLLADPSPSVRIAVAQKLAKLDSLVTELSSKDEWTRLAAAIALDELAHTARPALEALRKAVADDNRYVARVANHAVNVLTGARNEVA
jgi:arylsulfatase A-like enzyme